MAPINLLAEHNHTCKYCGRLFKFKWNLTEHVRRSHEIKKPHKCALCPKSFISKSDLKCHIISHNERLFKCKYCEKAFKSIPNRALHEDTHGYNQYQCSICKETFKKKIDLYSHQKDHRKSGNSSSYNCPHCYFTFSTLDFKNEHVSKVHRKPTDGEVVQKEKRKCSRSAKVIQEYKSCPMPPYRCIACAQTFKNSHYFLKHIKSAHPGENICHQMCQECGKKISANYFRNHMMSHYNIKPFACNVCDSRFSRQHELNSHMSVHITLRVFNCSECPSKFKNKKSLQKHKKEIHSPDIYTCNICNKLFKANSNLEKHIKRVHNKSENSIKCSVCNVEVFYLNLNSHMNQFHDDIKSLCEICGKTCRNAWYLKYHLKSCKKMLVKPPPGGATNCPYCSSIHQSLMILKIHCLKKHADKVIKCKICDHISVCKISYERHQNKHKNIPRSMSGNENSECYFCSFIAVGAESLAEHLKAHEFFECYFCGFIATGTHILAEHFKSHEYYKWLLSWNKVDSCCEESNYVVNATCRYLPSKDYTLSDYKYSLLVKTKKEISWIHYISDTKTKVSQEQRPKIHEADENVKKIKETKDYKLKSKVHQAETNETNLNFKPALKINQSRSYFVANSSLRSKANLDSVLKKFDSILVDSLKPEVIDENSSTSLFCEEKFEADESEDDIEQNHYVNAVTSPNINVVPQFNVTNEVPLKPFIYIEDLKKLDQYSLKDLLKSF